jgi:hypothetical protein
MSQETCRGLPNVVRFRREICGDLVQAERREWCLANGLGAYAAGTLAGSLTRRYHGLLVAPCEPPLGRRLILAKADATLVDGDLEYPLFTNRWADGILAPAGHMHIEAFRQSVRDEKCDDPRCVTMVAAAHDRGRPCAVNSILYCPATRSGPVDDSSCRLQPTKNEHTIAAATTTKNPSLFMSPAPLES